MAVAPTSHDLHQDAAELNRAPPSPSERRDPAVSPDGRLVAFTWMPDNANQEVFVMRRNGTGVRHITATDGVTEWGPD